MDNALLDKLLAHKLCTDLIIRFASLSDESKFQELALLFCEDGEFARPSQPDTFIRGRSDILKSFLARPPRLTRHVVSNVSVSVQSPTQCEATSTVCLFSAQPESHVALPPFLIGSYKDVLIKEGGNWLFKSRQGRVDLRVEV